MTYKKLSESEQLISVLRTYSTSLEISENELESALMDVIKGFPVILLKIFKNLETKRRSIKKFYAIICM